MKKLLILLALPIVAANYRSFDGGSGKYATVTVPNASPWNTRTVMRFEFRLHSWTGTGRVFQWDGFVCSKNANDVSCADFYEAATPSVVAAIPSGATDVIVRVQRTTVMWSIEIWRSDGSEYGGGQFVLTDAANFSLGGDALAVMHDGSGSSQLPAQLAWFRAYSTGVTRNSAMPTNVAGGDLLDYEFEGNGTDGSAQAQTLTITGSPTYPSTPVVPMVGETLTVRAGGSFVPDCSGTAADSYKWRQQGGPPLSVTFSSQTAAAPTVSGFGTFGEYTLTCEATINGVSGVSTLTVGSVATNDAGVVIPPDATISALLGPMLRSGLTEWVWYDRTRRVMGTYWNTQTANYTNNFTSQEAENYYDSCLVQYQNYYRTGLTQFQTYARACADQWWSQYWASHVGVDCASSAWMAPRQSSLLGLAIRAYETADATKWACLEQYAGYNFDLWVEQRGSDNGYTAPYFDTREGGYSFINAVAIAVAHPTGATRTAYAARVATEITNYARNLQCGSVNNSSVCTDNYTTGAGSIAVTNGSATVTGTGTSFNSLFSNGDTILFVDTVADLNRFLTVSGTPTATSLTLTANYTGNTQSGLVYAKRTTDGMRTGSWRWSSAEIDHLGFGDIVWQSALLVEGVMRAYFAGIATSTASSITTDYSAYMLAQSRVYPTYTCTGAFANVLARRLVYSVWLGDGDQGTGCASDSDLRDQRSQNTLAISVHGFSNFLSTSAANVTRGDDMFSAAFGEWIGTGADGGYGLANSTNGKFYGQSFRSASAYLAHRLGATAADTSAQAATVSVGFSLSGVANAAKIRVTLRKPDGVETQTTCTVSPCVATGADTRQGTTTLRRIEYLSNSDAVLAVGDWQ